MPQKLTTTVCFIQEESSVVGRPTVRKISSDGIFLLEAGNHDR